MKQLSIDCRLYSPTERLILLANEVSRSEIATLDDLSDALHFIFHDILYPLVESDPLSLERVLELEVAELFQSTETLEREVIMQKINDIRGRYIDMPEIAIITINSHFSWALDTYERLISIRTTLRIYFQRAEKLCILVRENVMEIFEEILNAIDIILKNYRFKFLEI